MIKDEDKQMVEWEEYDDYIYSLDNETIQGAIEKLQKLDNQYKQNCPDTVFLFRVKGEYENERLCLVGQCLETDEEAKERIKRETKLAEQKRKKDVERIQKEAGRLGLKVV